MSVMIGNSSALGEKGGSAFPISGNDDRAQLPTYRYKSQWTYIPDVLWPRSYVRATQVTAGDWNTGAQQMWDWTWAEVAPGMGQRRNSITGVTRNGGGAAIGGATVHFYRTVTDELVDTVTSDATGNYTVTTPYGSEAHFARGHLSGSPDLDGVTAQTLTPI